VLDNFLFEFQEGFIVDILGVIIGLTIGIQFTGVINLEGVGIIELQGVVVAI
jgi:hypothetical protein